MKYKRILLKLSGEAMAGRDGIGINPDSVKSIAVEIKSAYEKNIQIGIVIGAGNIWRGASKNMDRVTADQIGMIATVMNALALKETLQKIGVSSEVQSAFTVSNFVKKYSKDKTMEYLKDKTVVIFAGGTGNPYFTTDTTAALRAAEIKADVLLKATQVDGVYDDDPKKNKNAKKFKTLSFSQAISKKLKVMDTAAFSLCSDNELPIIVFNFHKKGSLSKVLSGEDIGTIVS
ncbi:MAG: UMP kinase [Elusimicrobia bacterium]|nr:UMP kinase [Elusimicrobiota bacterium]